MARANQESKRTLGCRDISFHEKGNDREKEDYWNAKVSGSYRGFLYVF
jgi:hypothetical protein